MDTAGRPEWRLSGTTRQEGHRRTSSGGRARMGWRSGFGAERPQRRPHQGDSGSFWRDTADPRGTFGRRSRATDWADWLSGEGEAPLDASPRPGAELERLSREAKCLVASPLRRSRDSARLLAPTTPSLVDPCFREAELPSAIRCGPTPPPGAVGVARTHGVVLRAGQRAWRA